MVMVVVVVAAVPAIAAETEVAEVTYESTFTKMTDEATTASFAGMTDEATSTNMTAFEVGWAAYKAGMTAFDTSAAGKAASAGCSTSSPAPNACWFVRMEPEANSDANAMTNMPNVIIVFEFTDVGSILCSNNLYRIVVKSQMSNSISDICHVLYIKHCLLPPLKWAFQIYSRSWKPL